MHTHTHAFSLGQLPEVVEGLVYAEEGGVNHGEGPLAWGSCGLGGPAGNRGGGVLLCLVVEHGNDLAVALEGDPAAVVVVNVLAGEGGALGDEAQAELHELNCVDVDVEIHWHFI